MSELLEQVKAQVSMLDALEALELTPPDRFPGHIFAPDRDETAPSLMIYEDHWFDYGTGEGGDVLDFVQHITG